MKYSAYDPKRLNELTREQISQIVYGDWKDDGLTGVAALLLGGPPEEMEMRSNGGALERKNYNIARNKLGREIETIKSRLEIIDFEFTRFRRKIKKGNAYERSKNEHYPKNIDDLI